MEDSGLIKEVLSGNIDSFKILLYKYERTIFNFVYRMVRNNEAAQDITQEVFITVYNKLYTFKHEHKFSNWLLQIARNKSLDYIRKYKRVYEINIEDVGDIEGVNQSPQEVFEFKETKALVEEFLRGLPEVDRQILILKYTNQNITFYDIASVLNMGESAVKSRYYRLKEKFKSFAGVREKRCKV